MFKCNPYLAILLISIISCSKEEAILKDLAGQWQLQEMIFSDNDGLRPDTVLQFTNYIFDFQRCTKDENFGEGDPCIILVSTPFQSFDMGYQIERGRGGDKDVLTFGSPRVHSDEIMAFYNMIRNMNHIDELDRDELVLECFGCDINNIMWNDTPLEGFEERTIRLKRL